MSDCCHEDFAFRFLSFILKNYLAYRQDKINNFTLRWTLLEGVEFEAVHAYSYLLYRPDEYTSVDICNIKGPDLVCQKEAKP